MIDEPGDPYGTDIEGGGPVVLYYRRYYVDEKRWFPTVKDAARFAREQEDLGNIYALKIEDTATGVTYLRAVNLDSGWPY